MTSLTENNSLWVLLTHNYAKLLDRALLHEFSALYLINLFNWSIIYLCSCCALMTMCRVLCRIILAMLVFTQTFGDPFWYLHLVWWMCILTN